MRQADPTGGQKIDKQHIEATILFAINHIPQVDGVTLEKFLELINATGNYGSITDRQLLHKMTVLVKYVPGSCRYSLLALAELLDVCLPVGANIDFNIYMEDMFH
jgi:hypothetical protein